MMVMVGLAALAVVALLVAIATWYDWELIPEVRKAWKLWSVKLGLTQVSLLGWLTVDPSSVLQLLNMMPFHVRTQLPEPVQQVISVASGFLLLLSMVTLVVRFIKQPKIRK